MIQHLVLKNIWPYLVSIRTWMKFCSTKKYNISSMMILILIQLVFIFLAANRISQERNKFTFEEHQFQSWKFIYLTYLFCDYFSRTFPANQHSAFNQPTNQIIRQVGIQKARAKLAIWTGKLATDKLISFAAIKSGSLFFIIIIFYSFFIAHPWYRIWTQLMSHNNSHQDILLEN